MNNLNLVPSDKNVEWNAPYFTQITKSQKIYFTEMLWVI